MSLPESGAQEFRETSFGEHGEGLISFYADDATETIRIANLVWLG